MGLSYLRFCFFFTYSILLYVNFKTKLLFPSFSSQFIFVFCFQYLRFLSLSVFLLLFIS